MAAPARAPSDIPVWYLHAIDLQGKYRHGLLVPNPYPTTTDLFTIKEETEKDLQDRTQDVASRSIIDKQQGQG